MNSDHSMASRPPVEPDCGVGVDPKAAHSSVRSRGVRCDGAAVRAANWVRARLHLNLDLPAPLLTEPDGP